MRMLKLRSFISVLFLALLLFPMAEKARHDLEHLKDVRCGVLETHFCKAEHNCELCDYIFGSAGIPPRAQEQPALFLVQTGDICSFYEPDSPGSAHIELSLRGPPLAV